jgi:DNA-binding FrmR family transcriptional regulator
MLNDETKTTVLQRLKRLRGQLEAIERMVEEDRYCVDTLLQIAAVQGALSKAGKLILRSHVEHCVAHAMSHGDAPTRHKTLEELMEVFDRYSHR